MIKWSALFLCLISSLSLKAVDSSATTYEYHSEKRHIDHFDFPGLWPNLENIDIDATKKYRIEVNISGTYPKLQEIHYKGSFGDLKGKVTGEFPLLTLIDFALGSTETQLDLRGKWQKECDIHIASTKGNITLTLPKGIGFDIVVKIGPRGKVETALKKKGRGWLERHYVNAIPNKQLHLSIETVSGTVTIDEKD